MGFPRLFKIAQTFPAPEVEDLEAAVRSEFARVNPNIRPGSRVCLTVGSRGIYGMADIVRYAVDEVKNRGGQPFIVPAMGSHGGATAEGQRAVLAGYGITQAAVGAPVLSSMDVVVLGQTPDGVQVHVDANAAGADAIILINRVKPHTDFSGEIESGLMKIMAIGLGKQKGAETIHSYGIYGLKVVIPHVARAVLARLPAVMGLAILENAHDRIADVVGIHPSQLEEEEKKLLVRARALLPSLPARVLDVLVVQEMGKNISGVGIDPNITGRIRINGQPDREEATISRIVALDLTPESHGNGLGMGVADVITRRLLAKVDLKITYANVITSTFLERGFIPITAENDQEAIAIAIKTCGRRIDPTEARLVQIRNTLEIGEVYVSESILPEVASRDNVRILAGPEAMTFDEGGNLLNQI